MIIKLWGYDFKLFMESWVKIKVILAERLLESHTGFKYIYNTFFHEVFEDSLHLGNESPYMDVGYLGDK